MARCNIWTIFKLPFVECFRMMVDSKLLIIVMAAIFININVIEPIRSISVLMGMKMSVWEPFAALSNSGSVLLMLPFLYVIIMASVPDNSNYQYFYVIRMSKMQWVIIQLLCVSLCSIFYIGIMIVLSIVFSMDFITWKTNFSDAVRFFTVVFPEKENSYVASLFPLNMINQLTVSQVVFYSTVTMYLYFLFLSQVNLFFSIVGNKLVGIITDFIVIILGTVSCSAKLSIQWLFPLAHTISWIHFDEVSSKMNFSTNLSLTYMVSINVVMLILILVNTGNARPDKL